MLNLTALTNAIDSLQTALAVYDAKSAHVGSQAEELLRDGVIQRFEYTFELSWKTLKCYLENYGLEKVDGFTNKQLFRAGFEAGLIQDAEAWMGYLKRRNLTSHVYEEDVAKIVYEGISAFLKDATYLLTQFQKKIHD